MASLTGNLVKDTYKALLKTSNNDVISGTEVQITDGVGGGTGVFIDTNGFLRASKVTITNGLSTEFLKADGTLDSTTYLDTTTTTSLIAEGSNLYFTYPRVLGTTLTGFLATSGNVTASDTILSAIEKIWYNIQTGGGGGGGYVPYSGATQDLDLGTYGLIADFVEFNQTPDNLPTASGSLYYNDDDETLNLVGIAGTIQQIGQEIYYPKCSNQTGSTILNGTLVMVNPAQIVQGEKLSIQPAITDGTYSADLVLGIATSDISTNGMVTWFGYVRDVDTANINLGGETWAVGNILYGDPSNAGGLTNVEPTAPNHKSKIAVITKIDGSTVTLMVRPTLGQHLYELHDVNIDTIADRELIQWNNTSSRWENKSMQDIFENESNLALGDVVGTWNIGVNSLQVGSNSAFWFYQGGTYLSNNVIYDTAYKYINNGYGQVYIQDSIGRHIFGRFASGTAGASATFVNSMTIANNGDVNVNERFAIGTSSFSSYSALARDLVVYNSNNAGMTIHSGITSKGTIFFANGFTGTDFYDGGIQYDHALNELSFYTQGANPIKMVGTQASSSINIVSTTTGNGGFFVGDTDDSIRGGIFYQNDATTDKLSIMSQGAYLVHITDKFGIGVLSPAYMLDVDGDLNITGIYRVNGSQISTSNVLEGSNLYYTQARFDTAFGLKTTTDLTEGTNLYYTDTRARLSISESITGITYTPATGVFSLTAGYVIPTTTEQTNWTSAYNNMIVSAGVSGTTTKTLTLTQQDGGTIVTSWTDYDTAPVTSVFGRTGIVIAQSGDYSTTLVTEGTNLYYTDARARASLSFSAGSGAYNSSTGVITIPTNNNQITNGAGYITGINSSMVTTALGYTPVPNTRTLTINGTAYDLTADRSWTIAGTIGGLTTNYIPKATSSTTLGNSLIYDDGTKIGIGVTSLQANLDINGVGNTTNYSSLLLRSGNQSNNFDSNQIRMSYDTTGNYSHAIKTRHHAVNYINAIDFYVWKYGTDTAGVVGTQHVVTMIQGGDNSADTGRLGVGTTAPAYKLDVNGTGRFSGTLIGTSATFSSSVTADIFNSTRTSAYLLRDGSATGYGIYKNSATEIGIASNGNVALNINSSGNVTINEKLGIGVTPTDNIGNLQIGGNANTSIFSQQGTDTVRIGVRASGRTGIAIDSSNATYTNRMWYIDNIGATGTLYIGRSGLDVLTLANSGQATFSSSVSVNGDLIIRKSGIQYGTLYASSGNDLFLESVNSASIYYNSVASLHTWRNNGSNAMTLNSTGLGIGMAPTKTMSISGPSNFWGTAAQVSFYDSYPIINARNWTIGAISTEWGNFTIASSTAQGGDPTTPRFTINKDGNVGIGTTAPAYKLDVNGTGRFAGRISTTGGSSNDVFSQYVTIQDITATNDYVLRFRNNAGSPIGYIGVISSGGVFQYNNSNGHNFTGQATFSSSVTAGSYYTFSSWSAGTINKIRGYSGNDDKSIQWNYDNTPAGTLIKDNNSFLLSVNGTNTLFSNSLGNVGIGTTSPSAKLHIQGTNSGILFDTTTAYTPRIKALGILSDLELMSIGNGGNLILTAECTGASIIQFNNGGSERMRITSGGVVQVKQYMEIGSGINASQYIRLTENQLYRTSGDLYINYSNGGNILLGNSGNNVGIGTTSPSYKLDVIGDINITGNYKVNGVNIGGSISGLTTNYVPRATSSTALGNSPIFIYNGVDFYFNQTSNSNSRFFIKANGSVSGTTYSLFKIQRNDSGSTTTAFAIREDGLTSLDAYGAYSPGQYTTSSGANLYYDSISGNLQMSTSSRRYKTDIKDYTKGLADVLNMRPRYYKGINDGDRIFTGLIAEEIHDIGLTEFVNYNKENQPNALEYSRMVAILINAIKELKAELDELKK